MSGESEFIFLPFLVAGAGVVGVAMVGGAVCMGATSAVHHLTDAYRAARKELEETTLAELREIEESNAADKRARLEARRLAEVTAVATEPIATESFMAAQLQSLERIVESVPGSQRTCEKLSELRSAILDGSQQHDLIGKFRALTEEIGVIVRAGKVESADVQSEFHSRCKGIEELLADEGLAISPSVGKKLLGLRENVAKTRELGGREPAMAFQSLEILEDHVRRFVVHAEAERRRIIELATDIQARLAAIRAIVTDSVLLEVVATIEARLSEPPDKSRGHEPESLEHLLRDAESLFERAMEHIAAEEYQQWAEEQLGETLSTLGYAVGTAEGGGPGTARSFIVALDPEIGMEVCIGADGRVSTEMVAFEEEAAVITANSQERVCSALDDTLSSFDDSVVVRATEKLRRSFPVGHSIRVVQRPTRARRASRATAEPKAMRMREE